MGHILRKVIYFLEVCFNENGYHAKNKTKKNMVSLLLFIAKIIMTRFLLNTIMTDKIETKQKWHYCNRIITKDSPEVDKYQGFVYMITLPDGKKYIGSKNLWAIRKLKPLKGKKRRRLKKVETDWETYYSSSETIKADIAENGDKGYKREILIFCESKGILAYRELELQMKHNVLFDDNYLNGMIQVRINKKSVKGYSPLE